MRLIRTAERRRTRGRHRSQDAIARVETPGFERNALLSHVALDALLAESTSFLLAAGMPRRKLAAELRKQARHVARGRRLQGSPAVRVVKEDRQNMVEIAGVIHDWHRQRRYTDKRGEPRPLRSATFRKLIGQRFPRAKITRALIWMQANRVITRRADGVFVPSMGRQVVFEGQRIQTMERAAALVPQYLRIALRNALSNDPRDKDVDRDARVYFLPHKYVRLWRAVALERTQSFLEGLDNWLEDHAQPDATGPTVEAAVHSYCYTGEPRSAKRARTNIARLEGRDN